ncbi:MAG: hypothetical protein FWG29_10740 [Treponema sp.]|nr:hypothetical protein [Treponema sp.]
MPITEGFTLPLESLLPDNLVKQLLQSGAIDRERFDTTSFGMVPRFDALERLIETNRRSIDPNVTVESLRLYKKRSSQGNWTAAERTELYNGLTAISTLKGLEYFSKSRNAMRLLYETSAVIDGPDSKNPRPDPVHSVPPAQMSVYVRQKDLTFGDNVYEFTYHAGESSFIVVQNNVTDLNYGPITVIGKNKLKSVVGVFDCGPYLVVYAASMAKASMLPGMKQRAGESIFNRANALLGWFTQKADRAFR